MGKENKSFKEHYIDTIGMEIFEYFKSGSQSEKEAEKKLKKVYEGIKHRRLFTEKRVVPIITKFNIKDHCISSYRIESEPSEKRTVEWLLDNTMCSSRTNLQFLKEYILCMDEAQPNYKVLEDTDKLWVEELRENEGIVNIVLISLFSWFGSSVGQFSINEIKKRAMYRKEESL